ncbi:hypothetical protein GA0111570_106229 [Raineyella antarctica]|uniref:Tripartite tricarboxylate transporter TctB family protein n=1 Tax=Raineyella antarctica TaxID=1577474 RepID=A0A1G6H539_9ACTN|nr:hypothetical protein [Raineyella antarctica]SDB89372.1 hypothetical protein GA0111570_106229 [Raineyella antarctica]
MSTRPTPPPGRRRRRTDVLSLVLGLMAVMYGGAILFSRMVHPIDPGLLSVAAPASLVIVGLIGLIAGSRT